ncbi:21098_t:CDS:1, partial [Gigaspora rosea]
DAGPEEVIHIEYDPNWSAHLTLLQNQKTGKLSYIIAPYELASGTVFQW